jgi:hypothetical protein
MPVSFSTRVPEVMVKYHWHGTYSYLPDSDKRDFARLLRKLKADAKLDTRYKGSQKYPIELQSSWKVTPAKKRSLQAIVRAMKLIMERHHRRMSRISSQYGKSGGYRSRNAWWEPKIDIITIEFKNKNK